MGIDTSIKFVNTHGPGIIELCIKDETASFLLDTLKQVPDEMWERATVKYGSENPVADTTHRDCFNIIKSNHFFSCHHDDPLRLARESLDEISDFLIAQYSYLHKLTSLYGSDWSILKYEPGVGFKDHYDASASFNRTVSLSLFLNDDFEGGELEFVKFGLSFKPKPGTAIMFPSSYPFEHRVNPITSGTRYAIVRWYHYQNTK